MLLPRIYKSLTYSTPQMAVPTVVLSVLYMPHEESGFIVYLCMTFFVLQRGAFVSEPAILVKRKNRSSQIWSLEKLENKVIDMREMYEDRKASGGPMMVDESFTDELDASVISGVCVLHVCCCVIIIIDSKMRFRC